MNILFIDTVHPVLAQLLKEAGHDCTDGSGWSEAGVLEKLPGYDGVVIRSRIRIGPEFLSRATSLKFIARAGAGMENIDTEAAMRNGVRCLNAPEGNRDAVGEHAVAMLLALFNHLLRSDREVREGKWFREPNRGMELKGKTVGVIGYGHTGTAFARKLSGFECRVLAYDKYRKEYSDAWAKQATPEDLFREADILSLHVPLTPETYYLVDDAFIGKFRKPVIVVNTSRGLCLRTEDLVKQMKAGKVTGACLDVIEFEDSSFENFFSRENDSWNYLLQSDRVILSPHIAGWTYESNEKIARVLFEKIAALAAN
jgi:D-3-phosphoglycerate dehydrogenase